MMEELSTPPKLDASVADVEQRVSAVLHALSDLSTRDPLALLVLMSAAESDDLEFETSGLGESNSPDPPEGDEFTIFLDGESSPELETVLRDVLRVLSAASGIGETIEHSFSWFRDQPIAAFEGLTAASLVAQGRADAVVRYLASIESGFVG